MLLLLPLLLLHTIPIIWYIPEMVPTSCLSPWMFTHGWGSLNQWLGMWHQLIALKVPELVEPSPNLGRTWNLRQNTQFKNGFQLLHNYKLLVWGWSRKRISFIAGSQWGRKRWPTTTGQDRRRSLMVNHHVSRLKSLKPFRILKIIANPNCCAARMGHRML